jgi:hypothetical protein
VTIVGGCPASVAGYADVSNPRGDLISHMLPSGIPGDGLICRYSGSIRPGHPDALAGATFLARSDAAALARSTNAIWTGFAGSSVSGCPEDNGLVDVIVFGYLGQSDIDLWYDASGCQSLDNGYISGEEGGNPSFYDGFQPVIARLTR